jgi:hypothetical protein
VTPKAGELHFEVRLGADSNLLVSLLDADGNAPFAFRISRSAAIPSAFLQIEKEQFLEKKLFGDNKLGAGYHVVTLRWSQESVDLQIDKDHFPMPQRIPEKFQLGFAGGYDPTDAVKGVAIREVGQRRAIFHENFLPHYGESLTLMLFCLFVLLIVTTGFLPLKTRFGVTLLVLVLLFAGVVVNEKVLLPNAAHKMQLAELQPMEILGKQSELTMLFAEGKTNPGLLHEIEKELRVRSAKPWAVVTKMPPGIQPAIVLLGVSMYGNTSCSVVLHIAQKEAPKAKIAILSIPEESPMTAAAEKREEECANIAAKAKRPFLSAHKALEESRDAGFLWWDSVHLTGRGLQIMINAIMPKLFSYVAH